jgi:general L-amino acid transport system permease protein
MAAVQTLPPPRLSIGPLAWLRKNLFSTWYNALLTLLAMAAVVLLLRSVLDWSTSQARWGAITSNITLFLIGQYPREQLWRIWADIYALAALVGFSWGLWKDAIRGFALIGIGVLLGAALLSIPTDVWSNWAGAALVLALAYPVARRVPAVRRAVAIGWVIYFPFAILLIAGHSAVPWLPPVETNLWGGLLLTLALTVVGNIGSLPLGILLALGRRSKLPALRLFCIGYIELIRGVPLITILYMAANMLPFFLPEGVRPDLVVRAMIGLIMFEAAYQAENVRGGLQAIPRGQYEAAHALGLNATLTTLLIVLPQALRLVIPALMNSFVSLFKDTSLVAIIGLFDVLRIGRSVLAQSDWLGTHREVFAFAFLIYWGFNLAFTYGSRRLEQAQGVGKR